MYTDSDHKLDMFRQIMIAAGLHPLSISIFEKYYIQLSAGETGSIPETDLVPLDTLPCSENLKDLAEEGIRELPRAVVIKLNGGLGTSMGMDRAKSLLEVKPGLTFLDVIVRQILRIRSDYKAAIPLILMNSDVTRQDTLEFLKNYPELQIDTIPLDFVQNLVPKIRQSDLSPASYPPDRNLEWNPPGHGDIYTALMISGCLDNLLDKGYRYAFISNSDNLGAELDPSILGYFASGNYSFMMEVAERTDADRKGGHLARHRNGCYILREIAQCAPEDRDCFADINRHRFFNTNSIWIHLEKLREALRKTGGFLGLPLIRNRKNLNPRDPDSEAVYQMETAMGAAISSFKNSTAICVPRTRFLPVKTTDDLIGLWSDAYIISDLFQLRLAPGKMQGVISKLDERFYRMVGQLQNHFPAGAPSLINCNDWSITGDVFFESNISVHGSANIINRSGASRTVPAGTRISGDHLLR